MPSNPHASIETVVSPCAELRARRASAWLGARKSAEEALVIGASAESAHGLVRDVVHASGGASFGWHALSLGRLAASLAAPSLAAAGLVAVGPLALEALAARVVHALAGEDVSALGRFAVVADRPGLPRALARTIRELRMAAVSPESIEDPALARVYIAYIAALESARLADRADVLGRATACIVEQGGAPFSPLPTLLYDVPLTSVREREFVRALASRAPDFIATVPHGDPTTLAHLAHALTSRAGVPAPAAVTLLPEPSTGLARLKRALFSDDTPPLSPPDGDVVLMSAPGESREAVEIARRMHAAAASGIPFDRMGVVLRAPAQYRAHLEEALRRAQIPAFFATGTRRPDPTGRALLALLACAAEGLRARRFAEYLSLGEVPDADPAGAPPPPIPAEDRWVLPDEEAIPAAVLRADDDARDETGDDARAPGDVDAPAAPLDADAPARGGTLRAPRRWERLLVDAAVIGGRDRWARRLETLGKKLHADLAALEDPDDPAKGRIERALADLAALTDYALPLLAELESWKEDATWGAWLDRLSALATRALRCPERVLAVLAELAPMAEVGPVSLREVRLTLGPRLTELVEPPAKRRYGRVFVGPAEAARGMTFDLVFVPGLAEKMFPQKVVEDPIFRDDARAHFEKKDAGTRLPTNAQRIADERLALHLAIGAAKKKVVLSYPRIDVEQARPRTPSFYGLEVLRAAEGVLPGFDELARRAEDACPARLGWPAPSRREDAIDEAEHDLALLTTLFPKRPEDTVGMARYLLDANPHLARALRARYARWHIKGFVRADGLVDPIAEAKTALAKHALSARSYSPTALQNFAACPYRFLLYAVHKLAAREEPEALEELDPLQKGSLVHATLFELNVDLRDAGLLPITHENEVLVRARLDRALDKVAQRFKDDLAPAIDRVWEDGLAQIKSDLLEWQRRAAEDTSYVPIRFELAFGLTHDTDGRDEASVDDWVKLDAGLLLRGSIDLVEENAQTKGIRATDYKTGKVRAKDGDVIDGGKVLQPILYALALEKLFPEAKIEGGRLYYCTSVGEFRPVDVPLDAEARGAASLLAKTISGAIDGAFLPAAPADGACEYCDYARVCGPYEEIRTSKVKRQDKLAGLLELRRHK